MSKNIIPIFIISLPRSGSTFLQRILSNNKYISTCTEPWILIPLISFVYKKNKTYTNCNLELEAIKDFFLNKTPNFNLKTAVREYVLKLYNSLSSVESKYFLDKTPRYYEYLNEIHELFPNAKFILLKRNPLNVLNSIINTWKVKDIYSLRKFYRDLLLGPKLIQEFIDNSSSTNIYEMRYEDIYNNDFLNIKRVFQWLNIDYTDDFFDYPNNKKLQGKFGDQTISKTYDASGITLYNSILNNNYWDNFALGYLNYFGRDFLNRYGYKDLPKGENSIDFKLYKYSLKPKRLSCKNALKNIIKNLYFYITTKKYRRKIFSEYEIL
jgi:hypothetical protein